MADTIGKRIKQQREKLALTQMQVAERLYVTQQTIARWESDKHVPPVKAIQDLSDLFGVDAAYFFGEDRIIAHKFNILALIGSLIVNFLLFIIALVVLIPLQLGILGLAIAGLIAPVVILWQNAQQIEPFTSSRLLASLVMFIVALVALPIIKQLLIYAGHLLRTYYRYNLNEIVYEVVPRQ
ncbi:helix-turn-helix domain-containing protein [Lactiplantibacillus songbeiensis]|uniref:Helix-turn-helix domain-containing protein n=1 Tax=Lactiplantibacillus songbeiensis TaxID=2559920 RepID=A0ABW4C165_9LACO|nr:helix-turn-helix transcriptional regulator [Lactiplantibacillus songbeiensis]